MIHRIQRLIKEFTHSCTESTAIIFLLKHVVDILMTLIGLKLLVLIKKFKMNQNIFMLFVESLMNLNN